jgi:HSP20 family protein
MVSPLVIQRNALSDPFVSARQEMDRLFGRVFGSESPYVRGGWYAPLAAWEDEQHFYVEVELPGVSKEDFELIAHEGKLRISGEKKVPDGERHYWRNERFYGAFDRTIALPDSVAWEKVDAEFANGVLRVTLPKRAEAQPRKVDVKG